MNVKDIIYKFINLNKATSDDSKLSRRLAYSVLRSARNNLMQRAINQRKLVKSLEYQTLCIETEEVDLSVCCGIEGECGIRSISPVPDVIDISVGLAIKGIYSSDGSNRFDITTLNDLLSKVGRRFRSNKPKIFFDNGYLYLYKATDYPTLRMSAVFEDPVEVERLNSACSGSSCFSALDSPFPYPGYMEDAIFEEAFNSLQAFYKIPQDRQNDAKDPR